MSKRNKTITLTEQEINSYTPVVLNQKVELPDILGKVINQDFREVISYLPENSVDLMFVDPPYNLDKDFGNFKTKRVSDSKYFDYVRSWLLSLKRLLKPHASLYICADWRSSSIIYTIAKNLFTVRNRITWAREKGRGSTKNWKSLSEDIWFFTMSNNYYTFNVEDVKLKRKVKAPYTDQEGVPKDWERYEGQKWRFTYPSNLWTDLTVPFWSMSENTDHPTQKPEKLLAKIILASSNKGDVIFDPFLGSGTTAVVAKKLGREFFGVEIDKYYCAITEERLRQAETDKRIQGYENKEFMWKS